MSNRWPHPLPEGAPARTLAQRLTARVDRLRQLNTRFGLRARRVFLTHTLWNGAERGEGNERVICRVEILPTPRVADATTINQKPWSGGTLPEGSIRVDQISASRFTLDVLTGVRFADSLGFSGFAGRNATPVDGTNLDPRGDPQIDFFFEIVEDGRGDNPAYRERFRLISQPWRAEGNFGFGILLEASSEPMNRLGQSSNQDDDL